MSAPHSATPAYTTLLTNLVDGLLREEKNVALREYSARRSFILSKSSSDFFSCENA